MIQYNKNGNNYVSGHFDRINPLSVFRSGQYSLNASVPKGADDTANLIYYLVNNQQWSSTEIKKYFVPWIDGSTSPQR